MKPDHANLARTEAALKAYDAHVAVVGYDPYQCDELAVAVGRAFGQDTADRNDPATCEALIRPGPPTPPPGAELSFVRHCVQEWVKAGRP